MKLLLLLSLLLTSCMETDSEKYDRFMSELDCPIILVAKTDKATTFPGVVVRDANGLVRTFSFTSLPEAVQNSRNIGDTLKPCNK